jgi:transposase
MRIQGNTIDFRGQHIYCGIDVHDKSWKVSIYIGKLFHRSFVQDPKPELLTNYLNRNFPGAHYHAAYEAGFCGFWIQKALIKLGVQSIIVNPADIPTTDKDKRQKEDKRDSRKIAKSLRNGDLEPIYIPSDEALEDRLLVRVRYTIAKELKRCKHRIKSFLLFYGISTPSNLSSSARYWSSKYINWLETLQLSSCNGRLALNFLINQLKKQQEELKAVTKQMETLCLHSKYKENYQFIITIPGIGIKTALLFLTEIVDIRRFSNMDKLSSYVGLIPSTNSSGEKERVGDITPRGHRMLRASLIESAWRAIGSDPVLTHKYQELCKRMNGNKAIVRVAKMLLSRIAYVLKNKKAYEAQAL